MSKSANAEIAVLQTQMSEVQATVTRIETKLDHQSVSTVTREEFEAYKRDQRTGNIVKIVGTVLLTSIIAALVYAAFGIKKG